MKTFVGLFLPQLRKTLAIVASLTAIEALGFYLAGVEFKEAEFALAAAVGYGLALLYSIILAGALRYFRQWADSAPTFTSLFSALFLLYLIIALWLKPFAFQNGPFWTLVLSLILLAVLMAGLGRFLWTYAKRGDANLSDLSYKAITPMAVVCAGAYSVADARISSRPLMATAVLAILFLLVAGQYLTIRFLWGRRRKPLDKWKLRGHVAVVAFVPIISGSLYYLERRAFNEPGSASPDLPSVVLITVDTLRADYLSAGNAKAPPTPHMDALIKDGIYFTGAVAPASWTSPSVSSLLTGLPPSAIGAGELRPDGSFAYSGPPPDAATLASVFKEKGYLTAAVVHNGHLSPKLGYGKGFDYYELIGGSIHKKNKFLISRAFYYFFYKLDMGAMKEGAWVTKGALEWMDSKPEGPFFLWVHYLDPHLPFFPHKEYPANAKASKLAKKLAGSNEQFSIACDLGNFTDEDREYVRQMYEGEVRFVDAEAGRVLDKLKAMGIYKDCLVALASDHGEELWDHGSFGHGHSFHSEVINVPLVLKLPGNKTSGHRVSAKVGAARLGATMLEAARIKSAFPGPSLLPLAVGKTEDGALENGFWLSENTICGGERGAIGDSAGNKVIFHRNQSLTCYAQEDGKERRPLSEEECPWPGEKGPREIFESFKKENQAIRSKLALQVNQEDLSPEDLKKIRAVGYIK